MGQWVLLSFSLLLSLYFLDELSTGDLTAIQGRLDLIEKRLTRLEEMEDKIVSLIKEEKNLLDYVAEIDKSGKYQAQRLDELSQKVDRLEKTMTPAPAKSQSPLTIQRMPSPLATGRYHEVRSGDVLYQIAQQYGTSVDELCRLNNMSPNQVIYPGQKLLVATEGNQ